MVFDFVVFYFRLNCLEIRVIKLFGIEEGVIEESIRVT